MTDAENLAIRLLELTDQQDWPGREALMTPDCEFLTPDAVGHGPAASSAYSRPIVGAFPDGRHHVDLVVARGDVVVAEGTWTGTHLGPLPTPDGEVPASGNALSLPFVVVLRLRGDLAAAVHVYFDRLAFLGQLGLVPQPRAAA